MKKLYITGILLFFLVLYGCSSKKVSVYDYYDGIIKAGNTCLNTWNSLDFENIQKNELISEFDQITIICNASIINLDALGDFEGDDILYNSAREVIISYLDFIDFFKFKLKNPSTSESENDIVKSELEKMYDDVSSLYKNYIENMNIFEKKYIFDVQEYINQYGKYYGVGK